MKKLVSATIKIGLSLLIVGWLVYRAMQDRAFSDLKSRFEQGLDWSLIGCAFLAMFALVLITHVRWYLLVRALEMPFTLREAFRLGFLGYLFNLAPLGIVGGDLLKAVMLAHQSPSRRAQAFATVAVDRVLGLYVLFLIASVAILCTGFLYHENATVRIITSTTLVITVVATVVLGLLFLPDFSRGGVSARLVKTPYIGTQLRQLMDALWMYRSKPGVLLLAGLLTVPVHALFTFSLWLTTLGIYDGDVAHLSIGEMFVVGPLAGAMGAVPLVMGPTEAMLDFLYDAIFGMSRGRGLVVSLVYRLITLAIAAVGLAYYLASRREVSEVMHEPTDE